MEVWTTRMYFFLILWPMRHVDEGFGRTLVAARKHCDHKRSNSPGQSRAVFARFGRGGIRFTSRRIRWAEALREGKGS